MQITPRPVLSLAPYRLTVMALEWTQCEQRSFIDLCRDSWGGQVRAIGRTLMINIAGEKRVSRFGLAVRLVSRRTSVRIRFGSPFSSTVVVCGLCLPSQLMKFFKMALIAARLNAGVILVVEVPLPPPPCPLPPPSPRP